MPDPSMTMKDIYQEQEDEMLAFPISREERKNVVQIALFFPSEQSRSYCTLQKWDCEMGKWCEEVEKQERNKSPPFFQRRGTKQMGLGTAGTYTGFDEPLKCN